MGCGGGKVGYVSVQLFYDTVKYAYTVFFLNPPFTALGDIKKRKMSHQALLRDVEAVGRGGTICTNISGGKPKINFVGWGGGRVFSFTSGRKRLIKYRYFFDDLSANSLYFQAEVKP